MEIRSNRFWFLAGIILVAAAIRVALVDVPNFKPIGAMALFGAAYFRSKWAGVMLPLAALFLSDLFQELFIPTRGFHDLMPFTYGAFALIAVMGFLLRNNVAPLRLGMAGLSSAIVFFLISNLGVWAMGGYPTTFVGLMTSYEMAIPFFPWTLAGDLFFIAVFFGGFELAKRQIPALALAK